jgi:thioredoxin reductase
LKAHNLITHDHKNPADILRDCKADLERYDCITSIRDTVIKIENKKSKESNFRITCLSGKIFECKKIMLTTGLLDILPSIPGFKE